MQENHENENTESVESTSSEPQVSDVKKKFDKRQFLIGAAIAIIIYSLFFVFQNTIFIWILVISAVIVFLLLNKKYRDTGIAILAALVIPILLLLLLFGACALGMGGLSLIGL